MEAEEENSLNTLFSIGKGIGIVYGCDIAKFEWDTEDIIGCTCI